jgi:hypothetical protein
MLLRSSNVQPLWLLKMFALLSVRKNFEVCTTQQNACVPVDVYHHGGYKP